MTSPANKNGIKTQKDKNIGNLKNISLQFSLFINKSKKSTGKIFIEVAKAIRKTDTFNKRTLGLKLNLILRESLNLKFRSKSNTKKEDRNINRFVIG